MQSMPSFKNFQASPTCSLVSSYCSYDSLFMNTNMSCWRYRNWAANSDDVGRFERLAGAVGAVDASCRGQVLQLALVQGVALARLAEIHFDHQVRHAVDLNLEAFAKITGVVSGHGWSSCVRCWYVASVGFEG